MAFAKVLSPQFLIWTIPLLALACAWGYWALAGATAGAIALTLVEFPFRYGDLLARDDSAVGVVALRDVLLIVATGLGLWALAGLTDRPLRDSLRWRPRGPARSTEPVLAPQTRSTPR